MQDWETRIRSLETEHARLRSSLDARLRRQRVLWLFSTLLVAGGGAAAGSAFKQASFDSIRAREVVVVDAKGTVRARMSGDMPDAVMANSHVAKRGSVAAGFMLYDEEGIERGGYVTQDTGSNAMLTLDSKYRQAALFVAGPSDDQTSALRLWGKDHSIELRSDDGGARVSIADARGVTYQQPVIALSPDACREQKQTRKAYPDKRYCEARYTEATCQACFDQP